MWDSCPDWSLPTWLAGCLSAAAGGAALSRSARRYPSGRLAWGGGGGGGVTPVRLPHVASPGAPRVPAVGPTVGGDVRYQTPSIHKDVSAADSVPVEPLEMALVSDFKQPFIK